MKFIIDLLYVIYLAMLLYLVLRPLQFIVMVLEGVFNFIMGKR
jgi:hypothetical protein